MDRELDSRLDITNYMVDHALPASTDLLELNKLYAVDKMIHAEAGPMQLAIPIVSAATVGWIGQLTSDDAPPWALHGDGKHKLHIGRWVPMTFGTHTLNW